MMVAARTWIRLMVVWQAVTVALAIGPTATVGQDREDITALRFAESEAVPALVIAGVAYDADTGAPIEAAQVYIRGTQAGALTDKLGRFRFPVPSAGTLPLVVQSIGYDTREARIPAHTDRGTLVEIGLRQQRVPMCGLIVCAGPFGCNAVEAIVRDVLTGVAPKGRVVMHVRGATASDSTVVESRAGDESVHLGAASGLADPGPYEVEVTAEGYAPWRARDIRRDECNRVESNPLRIWLFPERQAPRPEHRNENIVVIPGSGSNVG